MVAWAEDRIAAAKSSLQGELRWEFCAAPIMLTGDGLLLLQLPLPPWPAPAPCTMDPWCPAVVAPPADQEPPDEPLEPGRAPPAPMEPPMPMGLPALPLLPAPPPLSPLFPDPFVGMCGKYPPGEGRPSGPSPGLRLRTNAGGLQRCKIERKYCYGFYFRITCRRVFKNYISCKIITEKMNKFRKGKARGK